MSINPTLQSSLFMGNNDFTWWLGTVENADDKDAKLGRVKVNILGFHRSDEKPENLPWALVLQPTTNPAVSGVGNAANCLKPGSFVMGFFLDYPDCQQPVVLGSFYSQIKKVIEPGTQESRDRVGSPNRSSYLETQTGQPQDSERTIPSSTDTTATPGATFIAESPAGSNQVADNLSGIGALKVSDSIAAKSSPGSPSNPSGNKGETVIADGKDGPMKVIAKQIQLCIEELGNIFKTAKIYDPNSKKPVLTLDVDSEQQYITVSDIESFPPTGIIQIGKEKIGYNKKDEYSLQLCKRGIQRTIATAHTKGTSVTFIPKTNTPTEIVGKFTDKVVDIQSAVNMCLDIIRNLIWYIVNEVKSFLMAEVTKYLNQIGLSINSPVPYAVKTITEVVIQVLKTIGCTFDESLVDAIMGGIEGFIEEFVDQMLDWLVNQTEEYLNFAEQCINNIFGSIFELTSVATTVASAIEDIIGLINTIGSVGNMGALFDAAGYINADLLANLGNIVSFILNLLGIGCNRTTDSPLQITWEDCRITENNCNPLNFYVTGGIPGKWNPEYSKMFVQTSETGHTIIMDDTPHNNRLVIEAGNSKTGFHILDNGDIEVTNSNNKTEVTFGKQRVTIKGDVYLDVGGNYHLKVGGNYHLEVDGQFNLFANRESKITFGGEHETIYKNDAKLSAANGLAIAGSKIGLSASGTLDIYSPTINLYGNEMNNLFTSSWNLFCNYRNSFITFNDFKMIGGNKTCLRAGTKTDVGTGISQKFQATAEQVWKGGVYNKTIIGVNNETKMATDNTLTVGTTTKNLFATSLSTFQGMDFSTIAGINFKTAEGVKFDLSAALLFSEAPITLQN
jgi:hypothetical protein